MIVQLEANLKRELSKAYKEVHGKGPDETTVKIWGNVIIMKFEGALTQIEGALRRSIEGGRLVSQMRAQLIINEKDDYVPILEKVLGVRITGISYILGNEDSTLYLFATSKEDIIPE